MGETQGGRGSLSSPSTREEPRALSPPLHPRRAARSTLHSPPLTLPSPDLLAFQALPVPITSVLASVYSCEGHEGLWLDTKLLCSDSAHIVCMVIAAVLLPCFILMCLLQLSSSASLTPDWTGRCNSLSVAHGRAEVIAGIIKVATGLWYVFGTKINP